jgi:hypothetical protein
MHATMWIKQYLKDIENLSVILVGNDRTFGVMAADRHVAPLGHIILIPSQPVFALTP